jgi:methyl-accepting chemotaxis protein
MTKDHLSVQAKIVIAITLIFIAALAASTLLTARNERNLAVDVGMEKARDLAQSYFDSVNTMMLTGTMDQRENLRKKFLAVPGVREIRIVHAPGKLAGVGTHEARPQDALEARGVGGEVVTEAGQDGNGRFVTVVKPLLASASYLGTNCLGCHQHAEGTVLGAVRVTYSLSELDSEFKQSLFLVAGLNLLISLIGIALVMALMRRIIVIPLCWACAAPCMTSNRIPTWAVAWNSTGKTRSAPLRKPSTACWTSSAAASDWWRTPRDASPPPPTGSRRYRS